jgi:hypothetical protein
MRKKKKVYMGGLTSYIQRSRRGGGKPESDERVRTTWTGKKESVRIAGVPKEVSRVGTVAQGELGSLEA